MICPQQLCQLQEHVAKVSLTGKVIEYLVDLGQATRKHKEITLGLSPARVDHLAAGRTGPRHIPGGDS